MKKMTLSCIFIITCFINLNATNESYIYHSMNENELAIYQVELGIQILDDFQKTEYLNLIFEENILPANYQRYLRLIDYMYYKKNQELKVFRIFKRSESL